MLVSGIAGTSSYVATFYEATVIRNASLLLFSFETILKQIAYYMKLDLRNRLMSFVGI